MTRRKDPYIEAVRTIQTDKTVPATTSSAMRLAAEIEELSQLLRGPLSNIDRLELYEAKRVRQRQLAELTGAAA